MLWSATVFVHVRGRPFKSASNVGAVAIRYATSRRVTFERFFIDGRVEIESNIVERAIIDC